MFHFFFLSSNILKKLIHSEVWRDHWGWKNFLPCLELVGGWRLVRTWAHSPLLQAFFFVWAKLFYFFFLLLWLTRIAPHTKTTTPLTGLGWASFEENLILHWLNLREVSLPLIAWGPWNFSPSKVSIDWGCCVRYSSVWRHLLWMKKIWWKKKRVKRKEKRVGICLWRRVCSNGRENSLRLVQSLHKSFPFLKKKET